MKKAILLIAAVLFLGNLTTKATHIVGGEFDVKWLHDTTFQITLHFYRDCSGVYFDTPTVAVGIYDLVTNANIGCLTVPIIDTLTLKLGDKCYTPPNLCVQLGTYQTNYAFPTNPHGYYITYSRCCRNGIITNIVAPGSAGETWYAEIPDPALHNSTPTFVGKYPKSYFCVNNPNIDSLTCTDPDGDSLVYRLVTPLTGHTSAGNPLSFCPDPGPYPLITWNPPYDFTNMIGGSPAMAIDIHSGVLTTTPPNLGVFLFGVVVEEWTRGANPKKLGEVRRDIQYQVLACTGASVPAFLSPTTKDTTVKAGDTLNLSVIVHDPTDTVSITLSGVGSGKADLFTNGSNTSFQQPVTAKDTVKSNFRFIPTCGDTGTYHIEFSAVIHGCYGTVTVPYDLNITVAPPDVPVFAPPITFIIHRVNSPDSTVSIYSGNSINVTSGDSLVGIIITNDVDPTDSIFLAGQSELLGSSFIATFPAASGFTPVQSTFNFAPGCKDIRAKAYHVIFNVNHCYANSTFDFDIYVNPPMLDPIPNIFTPNGDKKNDNFELKEPVRNFNCDFSIKVFDRWGLLMFESNDANFKWDGTNKSGSKVSEGVYYYIIEANVGPTPFKRRGTVNVKL